MNPLEISMSEIKVKGDAPDLKVFMRGKWYDALPSDPEEELGFTSLYVRSLGVVLNKVDGEWVEVQW